MSEEIKKLQEALTDKDTLDEEWQQALLGCGVVRSLVFRCPLKSV